MRDRAWFEALFADTQVALRRYAARRLPPDDVDDLVADVYVSAWQARERIPDPPLPWLYRAAAHHLAHARRGAGRRARLSARLAWWGEERVQPPVEVSELDGPLATVLSQLPAADAEILRLHAWEDLSPAQIAVVQGCTAGAARVRLHRARRRAEALWAATTDAGPPAVPLGTAPQPSLAPQESTC